MIIENNYEINTLVIYCLFGLFFLAVGSFLNVLIYRLPKILQNEHKLECQRFLNLPITENQKIFNLWLPRSFCVYCNHPIKIIHNIPLLSYFFLKGRCAYCQNSISLKYPLVEFITLILSLCCLIIFGLSLKLIFSLIFVWILLALFFIDLEHHLLPDSLTIGLLWVGLIANINNLFSTLSNAVLSAALGYLILWLVIKIYFLLTQKIGMGNGDFKLFAALGAWFGLSQLPFILLFSSLSGAIGGLIYLKYKNKTKETPIPFGPFLCIAGLISLFSGNTILNWYLT